MQKPDRQLLNQMMVFSAIVEAGSISSAADQLAISKSVVSQHLQGLESRLGVSLLQRTTRRQQLTSLGERFYQHCLGVQRSAEAALASAQESRELLSGRLTISAPHALIEPLVAPAIGALTRANPGLEPHLLAADTRVALIDSEVDLAIRVGQLEDSSLRQRRLGSFSERLCASPEYLQGLDFNPEDPQQFAKHAYIANRWQGQWVRHALRHQQQSFTIENRPSRFGDSLPAVLGLCLAGAGVALLPSFIASGPCQRGELRGVFDTAKLEAVDVYAVHGFAAGAPRRLQLAIDALAQQMAKLQAN